jgi:hypothetical protein
VNDIGFGALSFVYEVVANVTKVQEEYYRRIENHRHDTVWKVFNNPTHDDRSERVTNMRCFSDI